MAISFKIRPHGRSTGVVIDVYKDGKVCASIYPDGDNGIRIISAHFAGDLVEQGFPEGVKMDNGIGTLPPIPAVLMHFDLKFYVIDEGGMRRGSIVHGLHHGQPLCRFSTQLPRDWPDDHIWADPTNVDIITCPLCREIALERRSG